MFRIMRATLRGRKVAAECQVLCKTTVNHLVQGGIPLRLVDTARILHECYAFCNAISLRPWMNDLHRGQMLELSKDIVGDFLEKVYAEAAPDLDFREDIKAILLDFVPYFKVWLEELVQEHPELAGTSIAAWHPAATSKFAIGVESYIADRFGSSSSVGFANPSYQPPITGLHEYLLQAASKSAGRLA